MIPKPYLSSEELLAMNAGEFRTPPYAPIVQRLGAAGSATDTIEISAIGRNVYVKECDYPIQLALDNGEFVDWDPFVEIAAPAGMFFRKVRIKNVSANANNIVVFAGFLTINDRRDNPVEWRNGSAASFTPVQITRATAKIGGGAGITLTLTSGVWADFLALDPNARETLVYTDATAAGQCYWSTPDTGDNAEAPFDIFNAAGEDGFVRLRNKSAIRVMCNTAGKTIWGIRHCF